MGSVYRNAEVDIVKGLGIILMVIGHMHISDNLDQYIYGFHMPLFFIMSGYLYSDNKTIKSTISSKAKLLLIPYFAFGGGYCLIYGLLKGGWKDCLISLFFFPTVNFPIESAMWFLPVMFCISVGYRILDEIFNNNVVLTGLIFAISVIGFIVPEITTGRVIWGLDSAMIAILFYHTGRRMKDYDILAFMHDKIAKRRLLVLLLFVMNIALIMVNPQINMRMVSWGIPPLTYANAIVATCSYLYFSWLIARNPKYNSSRVVNWVKRISVTSIIYLCTNHVAIIVSQFVTDLLLGKIGIHVKVLSIFFVLFMSMLFMSIIAKIFWKTSLRIVIGKSTA